MSEGIRNIKFNIRRGLLTGLLLVAVAWISCKKPYQPETITTDYKYLVVEGTISPGDSTFFKLSRTTPVNKATPTPELKAIVTIEDEQSNSYLVKETGNGTYSASSYNLDNAKKYRLRIKTSAGKTYLSDFVPVKNSPPIDSIGFIAQSDALQLYANTHDATGNTRYYRWEFSEAWVFNALYFSNYVSDGKQLLSRSFTQLIHQCYTNDLSATVSLGSTAQLTQDKVYQDVINTIPSSSEKISIRYSILVKQYALTVDAYSFWSNIKKNTEDLGSIFDAQPTELKGNIHNVSDPTEAVIGYVSAGNVQSKRVFINRSELPKSWQLIYPYPCQVDTAKFSSNQVTTILIPNKPISAITIDQAFDTMGMNIGYLYSDRQCADCTVRGVTTPPLFWK